MAMDPGLKLRAFLALPLAPAFQIEVDPLLKKLRQGFPEIRWVEASKIHLTLHFFGDIATEEVPRISQRVRPVVERTGPIEIFLKGIGGFPDLYKPRVIWLGIEGALEALSALHKALEEGFKKEGFPCEDRPFKAHLTLGRVKRGKAFKDFHPPDFGPTTRKKINEIILFRSHLTPEGPCYEAIETYPFSAP